ncbi:MAG: cytochrome c [Candidatus Omnitrophota bacterium]
MDLPVFHLDFFGNRILIGIIAIVHVFINHPMAVGAMPLITLMEWTGKRTGDRRWDDLAYKILTVCFIVTTSLGALTGVGIWFSTSLVNPYAIGSLIHIFYWAWFTEWIVFCVEVILILLYYLLWKKWEGPLKNRHIILGAVLSISSWLTMAIITAILAYMMDIGDWRLGKGLLAAIMNPLYLPQLAFRTPLAMATAGFFALLLTYFFLKYDAVFRASVARWISIWTLAWLPFCLAAGIWYWRMIPDALTQNLNVAVATQIFETHYNLILVSLYVFILLALLFLLWVVIKPLQVPRYVLLIPFMVGILTLGYFERVREFLRKPYVIADYMYANGIRVDDYPLLNQRGILPYAVYAREKTVTDENKILAGRDVFMIACTRCHTTNGVNGILAKFQNLYGPGPWDAETMALYIRGMHNARPFMPPFPGNDAELNALVQYLLTLRQYPIPLKGAQTADAVPPPNLSHANAGADSRS